MSSTRFATERSPSAVRPGLTATARSVRGTLRQDVFVGGHRLTTDEPERIGGEGTAPAPHELLPAALAACVSTTLLMYARTRGWDIGDVTVDVDYDHKASPRRFEIAIALGADLDEQQVARLEKVAAACPLRRSLETGFEFEERLEVHRSSTAAGPGVSDALLMSG